jgi:phage head maturation protease
MERGDLDKMSFAFWATRQEWDDAGPTPRRIIREAQLHDVSIVTTPAYDGTEIGLRSLAAHRRDLRAFNFRAARRRLQMDLALRARENGRPRA